MRCPFCLSEIEDKSFVCRHCRSNLRLPKWEESVPIPTVDTEPAQPSLIFREPSTYSLAFIFIATAAFFIGGMKDGTIYWNIAAAVALTVSAVVWSYGANIWRIAITGFGQPLISFSIYLIAKDSLLSINTETVTEILLFAVQIGLYSFGAGLIANAIFRRQVWKNFMNFYDAIAATFKRGESLLSRTEGVLTKIASIASIVMGLLYAGRHT